MNRRNYTCTEVAQRVGITRMCLFNWLRDGKIAPPPTMRHGRRVLPIWDQPAIERVLAYARSKKRVRPGGRPRLT